MIKLHLTAVALSTTMTVALTACGGGGTGSTTTAADTSGQVVNSYITGATVTLDLNDDGICDASEPQVTSDATGHYLFSAKGAHLVCATGGTNTVTGLPFVGVLKAPAYATVVTPLTTLVVAQVQSTLPSPSLGTAAPLDPTAVAAAQTKVMAQLGLPAAAPILTTDPVALMTKAGATAADAKLEQTNASVQVLLQQVAQMIVASANLPANASATTTNEAFGAAANGLQTALTAVGSAPFDFTTATQASTGQLLNATALKAAATAKASQKLAGISASFSTISPTNVAAAIAASPLAALVNSVGSTTAASLSTQGGAETVAVSATQLSTVIRQISGLLVDSADAGTVSVATLSSLINTLLPTTGIPVTQVAANAAIANAVATINANLPTGKVPAMVPVVPIQPAVTIPKG